MGLRINTNLPGAVVQRYLASTTEQLQKTFARLSSGLRMPTAAEDPAGMGVSRRLWATLTSERAVQRNIEDGLSMVRTSIGGLSDIHGLLTRMRELSVQAANASANADDRAIMDEEFQGLYADIERIAGLEFNGQAVLGGSTRNFQVGTQPNNDMTIVFADALQWNVSQIDTLGVNVLNQTAATDAMVRVDNALNWIESREGLMASYERALESAYSSSTIRRENLTVAHSRISDADIAHEFSEMARLKVAQEFTTALLAQANVNSKTAFDLLFN